MSFRKFSFNKFCEGIVERAVDMVLLTIYFNMEFPSNVRNKRGMIEEKVQEDLEEFNYQTFKRACNRLKQKGFIQLIKEADTLPKITEAGEKRVKRLIPFYDKKRIWDGRIYLVTYDLPVKKNKERDCLRIFLKRIGCGMLQQSIWVTPYNPTILLKEFIEEHDLLEELVLVSSVERNGAIGGMTFSELIEKVYDLSSINEKYKVFIKEAENNKETRKKSLIFQFLSILRVDPQLPFELLPGDWAGREAYRLFKGLI